MSQRWTRRFAGSDLAAAFRQMRPVAFRRGERHGVPLRRAAWHPSSGESGLAGIVGICSRFFDVRAVVGVRGGKLVGGSDDVEVIPLAVSLSPNHAPLRAAQLHPPAPWTTAPARLETG